MDNYISELTGAWEEPGVIGTRVEIDGSSFTVLWRNAPVLETSYTAEERDGAVLIKLEKTGLRYRNDVKDYAEVTGVSVRDGKLELRKHFPITGESTETLSRTQNSRYGNYDIVDGLLDAIQGEWKDENGFFTLKIEGNKLNLNERKTTVHMLSSRPTGEIFIADSDPSVYEWQGLSRFRYVNGVI